VRLFAGQTRAGTEGPARVFFCPSEMRTRHLPRSWTGPRKTVSRARNSRP